MKPDEVSKVGGLGQVLLLTFLSHTGFFGPYGSPSPAARPEGMSVRQGETVRRGSQRWYLEVKR